MAEVCSSFETNLSKKDAYKKCLKKAYRTGFGVNQIVPGERLRIEKRSPTLAWWLAVFFGIALYIIPGLIVMLCWKQIEYCDLTFEENNEGNSATTVNAKIKGETGQELLGQISEILAN